MAELMFEKMSKNAREFKRLGIRKVDVVALLFLSIYKTGKSNIHQYVVKFQPKDSTI